MAAALRVASDLIHDALVGCGEVGVCFRWYCGVVGLVARH